MPDFSRVIIAHTLSQATTACKIAAELNAPLILQSAPGALFYAGEVYLLRMFEQAKAAYPHAQTLFIIDCEGASGLALAALQTGHRYLRSSASPESQKKLADVAAQYDAHLVTGVSNSLDLAEHYDIESACRQWLAPKA